MKDEKNSKLRCLVKKHQTKILVFPCSPGNKYLARFLGGTNLQKKKVSNDKYFYCLPVTHPGPATYLGPICIAKPINVCKNLIIYLPSAALDSAPARAVKSAVKCPAEKYAT